MLLLVVMDNRRWAGTLCPLHHDWLASLACHITSGLVFVMGTRHHGAF
jgi:hypothetical protein